MVQSYYFLGTYARKLQTFFNLYYSVSKKGAEEDAPDSEKGLEKYAFSLPQVQTYEGGMRGNRNRSGNVIFWSDTIRRNGQNWLA